MRSKFVLCFFFIVISFSFYGQNELDSLSQKDYIELFNDLNERITLDEKVDYATYIIKKAKREDNKEFIIAGYHTMMILYENENVLKYADSIIALTKDNVDVMYPAEAYRMKGAYYNNKKDYVRALDNYIIVSEYAKRLNDKKLLYKSNHSIAIIKRLIGKKEEALKLFKENLAFAKNNRKIVDSINYVISLSSVANVYNDLELGDSATYYNKLGLKEALKIKNKEYFHHFSLNQGLSLYHMEKYQEAIDSITKHVLFFKNIENSGTLSLSYFYCGMSYEKLNDQSNAIKYFKKVDTIFRDYKYIFPSTKEAYFKLIDYYKNERDLEKQLVYVNQLLEVDSILNNQYLYNNKLIYEKYDIPKLENERERILSEMNDKESNFKILTVVFTILLIAFFGIIIYQFKMKKLYKRRFNEIINKNKVEDSHVDKIESTHKKNKKKDLNLPENIVNDILKKLKKFEQNKLFTKNNLSQNSLAKEINTNSSYLSKIINHYKNKTFSNYINSLRIEYFIYRVENESDIRKYTIKAIAEEVGFNNAESFSTAFYKFKGIKPSYFLREFEKSRIK